MLNIKMCTPWPSSVSSDPRPLALIQGYMEICTECGKPFRRMATSPDVKFVCGACYPAPALQTKAG
jgi:hypothetical protein